MGATSECAQRIDQSVEPILKEWGGVVDRNRCTETKAALATALATVPNTCRPYVDRVHDRIDNHPCDGRPVDPEAFASDHASVTILADACPNVDVAFARDVWAYLDDLLSLRRDASGEDTAKCTRRIYIDTYVGEVSHVTTGCRPARLVFHPNDQNSITWTPEQAQELRRQTAKCRRDWIIVKVSLFPRLAAPIGHAVLLLFHGNRQQFFDPMRLTHRNREYQFAYQFFRTHHLLLDGPDARCEIVDDGLPSHIPPLQRLLEPVSGDPFGGRCAMLCLLVMCCCLRFNCHDLQRMTDALRCVLLALPDDRRHDSIMRGLCSWQNEFRRIVDDRSGTTDDDILWTLRLRNHGAAPRHCGVLLGDGDERCTDGPAVHSVHCERHRAALLGTGGQQWAGQLDGLFEVVGIDEGLRPIADADASPLHAVRDWVAEWMRRLRMVSPYLIGEFSHEWDADDGGWIRVNVTHFATNTLRLDRDLVCTMDATFAVDGWDGVLVLARSTTQLWIVPCLVRRLPGVTEPPPDRLRRVSAHVITVVLEAFYRRLQDPDRGPAISAGKRRVYDALRVARDWDAVGSAHPATWTFVATPRGMH